MTSPSTSRYRFFAIAALAAITLFAVPKREVLAQAAPTLVRVYAGTATTPAVTVAVAPSNASVAPGTTLQFTAMVTGTPNTSVVWSATGGTMTASGQFTAGVTAGIYAVTATIRGGTLAGSSNVVISTTQAYVDLQPGQDIQSQINLLPPGTAFRLEAGLYRLTRPLAPKNGDSIVGEVGTIVSGARLLGGFTRSGNYWTVGGQTQQGRVLGTCLPDYPRCANPEELYFDDVPLRHVGTLADVGPGKWYFDYAGDRIYFYDDPTDRRVETAVTPYAFGGTAQDVTIAGLVIEKFANRAQLGAVHGESTSGWTVRDSEIRLNHGLGIRVGPLMNVLANNVHHNGQMGIAGTGDIVLVEGNEIAYNNTANYDPGWEAGGTKFVKTYGLIVRNNFVHHNSGPGLWTDDDNRSTLYEGNRVEDNLRMGILHEISYSAIIRNNSLKRNGLELASWVWGAGIVISSSPDVEVYGNVLEGNAGGIAAAQQKRGSGAYGPYEISNFWVHDNSVTFAQGYSGLAEDIGDTSYFTSRNNRFDRNTYYLGTDVYGFAWMDGARNESQWRGYGNDLGGTFVH